MTLFKSSSSSKSQRARAAAESAEPPSYSDSTSGTKTKTSSSFSNSTADRHSKGASRGSSISLNPKDVDDLAKKAVQQNIRQKKVGQKAPSPIITNSRGTVGSLYNPREAEMERLRIERIQEARNQDFVDVDGEPWVGNREGRERLKKFNKNQKPPPGQGPCQTM